jgi:amidase
VEAATSVPGRLRIAVSSKPSAHARVDDRVRQALEETATTLRSLGHDVREADPDYPVMEPLFMPRWAGGVHDDVQRLPHPRRLERRTRHVARLGKLLQGAPLRRAMAAEPARSAQINRIFDDHDLLLTPTLPMTPWPLGRWEGRSIATTMLAAGEVVGFTSVWNYTGQPAASLPAALTDDGVPIGVQLVSRPGDEATILSVAAQLEAEIGWPDRRPPIG